MKFLIVVFFVSIALLLLNNCDSTDPKLEPELLLELEHVSCTEAWLELTTNNVQLPVTINLLKNDSVYHIFNLSTKDSLLYIDSLLPNQNYKLLATMQQGNNISNELSVTTLDTTSHNFTWQTFEFGQHQHSVLYDVAVIDENNIWAVGAIYMNDSLGVPDPQPYGIVHWNGNSWRIMKIIVQNPSGGNSLLVPTGIFIKSASEIWLASGGVFIYNGEKVSNAYWLINYSGYNGGIFNNGENAKKVLLFDFTKSYTVGNKGAVGFFNGTTWSRVESGTTVDLLDMSVTPDGKTIWACGYTDDYGTSALIRIKGGISEKVFEDFSNSQNNGYYVGPISGVWSDNDYRVFMMNWGGIYLQRNNNHFFLEKEIARFSDVGFGIDGTAYNNVFACGEGFVGHWNGYSYKEYPGLFQQQRTFKSVKTNSNTVCAVGLDYNSPIYSNAVIVLGK
ncbi:MAG: hypothetical protein IPJ23_17485 [Ignavibacteriales bacterium]|nr:hypothetical protein [Ignavibacteriales bacterium]